MALRERNTWLLALCHTCGFGMAIVISTWVTLYLVDAFGLTLAVAGLLGSLTLVTGIVARTLGGVILEGGMPPVRLIRAGLTLAALGLTTIALAPLLAGCHRRASSSRASASGSRMRPSSTVRRPAPGRAPPRPRRWWDGAARSRRSSVRRSSGPCSMRPAASPTASWPSPRIVVAVLALTSLLRPIDLAATDMAIVDASGPSPV